MDRKDPKYEQIKAFVKGYNYITLNEIQKKFKLGFNESLTVYKLLEQDKIIAPKNEKQVGRKVLVH